MAKHIWGLVGPTASGKTAAALALAQRMGGEILCMDSMQVYRGMDIGTAKPTPAERALVPHHLLDLCGPEEPFSVSDWLSACEKALETVRVPILCGGTGLYLDALSWRQSFGGAPGDERIRKRLKDLAAEKGNEALHALLRAADPVMAARLHPNDVRRVIRALEVRELTGRSLSDFAAREADTRWDFTLFAIDYPRAELYARIDRRVDEMVRLGLGEEVRALLEKGVGRECTSMQGIGYKETADCLRGLLSPEEAVSLIKLRTRHYAKRQLTWFRRDARITWLTPEQAERLPETIRFGG